MIDSQIHRTIYRAGVLVASVRKALRAFNARATSSKWVPSL